MKITGKTRNLITYILYIASLFFVYQIWSSINSPIEFNKVKVERYQKVIDKLKDLRVVLNAYKSVKGEYTNSFDSLVKFVENDIFYITEKRDTSYMEYDKVFRIDRLKEDVIIDTIGRKFVKDSLFKSNISYKNLDLIPIEGINDKFKIETAFINEKGEIYKGLDDKIKFSVFEVRVPKRLILNGLDEDLILQEENTQSVDGVNGKDIVLGSLTETSSSGNWPKNFDVEAK